MNSKERVQACIDRKPTDAVPLGFYLVDHDTISRVIGRPTYVRNRVATQIAFWEGRRDEVVESMKQDVVEFYRKVEICDLITFKEAAAVPPKGYEPDPPRQISDDCWEDRHGRVYKISRLSNEFVCVKDPVAAARRYTREEFEKPVEDTPVDPTTLEVYDHLVSALSGERYVAGLTGGFSLVTWLGGMEQGMMACVTDPEMVSAAFRRSMSAAIVRDRHVLRPGLGGAFIESDMSTTRGPMLSPAMWRDLFLPDVRRRVASLRERGLQVILHSCGNTRLILDDLIDAGVQVYQSIQSIPDMWVGDLKRDFGDRLVLWGGMPVEELISGTPETVRQSVRRAMEAAAPGGGFILGPSHSVAYGTKYDNFMAMLEEFDRLRFAYAG